MAAALHVSTASGEMDAKENVTSEKPREGLKRRNRAGDRKAAGGGDVAAEMTMTAKNGRRRPSPASSPPWTLVLGVLLALSTVFLVLLALGIVSLPTGGGGAPGARETEHFEIRMPVDREALEKGEERWTEVVSWEPRAFVFHNFLTKEECAYLIEVAKPSMEKSTVVDNDTGKSKDSRVRTSSGTFLRRGQDDIIQEIEKRIAEYTFIPVEQGEGLQVLHYEVGQKYEAHYDFFHDDLNTQNGGQRIATMLMYLSDVEEGGETVFPDAAANSSSLRYYNELSECGKTGIAVRPKMGNALLFWSMKPDATLDPSSLHAGCPVIKGDKWSSTKWMRVNEYKTY